jgi:hypothetical protein
MTNTWEKWEFSEVGFGVPGYTSTNIAVGGDSDYIGVADLATLLLCMPYDLIMAITPQGKLCDASYRQYDFLS